MPIAAVASPGGTAMASPSRIPLPKSRVPVAVAAAVSAEEDPPAAAPVQHVSRIPKAVMSPERTAECAEKRLGNKENLVDNGWKRSRSGGGGGSGEAVAGGQVIMDGSATFVRRPSPPRSAVERSDASVHQKPQPPQVEIDDEVFRQKLQQSKAAAAYKNSSRENISPPKFTTGGSNGRRMSTSSTGSVTSNGGGGGSRIPIASDYASGSPTRQVSPPRKISSSSTSSIPQPLAPGESEQVYTKILHDLEVAKEAMQLELAAASSSNGNSCSRIPLPKTARTKTPNSSPSKMPTIGFSMSPERMKAPTSSSTSMSSSPLKKPLSSYSTSNMPIAARGPKQFEAFVMTGDRIINLAKTPANNEFKSRYNKSVSESNMLREKAPNTASVASLAEEECFDDLGLSGNNGGSSPSAVTRRPNPVAKRSLMRASKSEDQLMAAAAAQEGAFDDDEEATSGSVNTLIADTSGVAEMEDSSSFSRPTARPSMTSPPKRPSPEEICSMTSSLMSCSSEHYNTVESVLENRISPNSSSSPDTPEWSLIDSMHKAKNGHVVGGGSVSMETLLDESIMSRGNKVIISIGDNVTNGGGGERRNSGGSVVSSPVVSSPTSNGSSGSGGGSSTNGTMTPDAAAAGTNGSAAGGVAANNANCSLISSSEEDSDMESLHSYHPPAKVIDIPSAVRLAKRLFHLDGFKKTDVSRHLSKNTDYNRVVAEEYLKYFDFSGRGLDDALRQERERVLFHFSRRYLLCNPECEGSVFASQDAVHTLTCAIMLLNTDLHGENIQRKMTCQEFVDNLAGLNDNRDFPTALLRAVYGSIKATSIPWSGAFGEDVILGQQQLADSQADDDVSGSSGHEADDEGSLRDPAPFPSAAPPSAPSAASALKIGGAAGGVNPFLSLPVNAEHSVDYKNGYVMRKSCFDAQGKKTKMGKRSWKMFFLTLREMVLYCFKEEKSMRARGAFEDPSVAIRIHHGLAVRATDYSKKQFVFRLYTADQAQYLFQTSDEKELMTWINAINYVVASFASPQLPAACASSSKFQRPLLPSSRTRLNPADQLEAHEKRLMELRDEIEDHLQHSPQHGTLGGGKNAVVVVCAYKEKTEFLKFEIMRYETYIITLRTRNGPD